MKLPKSLKKLSGNTNLLLMVVGGAVLVYFLYSYSKQKGTDTSKFTQKERESDDDSNNPEGAVGLEQTSGPASAAGGFTDDNGLPPSDIVQKATNPAELLPSDSTNQNSLGELSDINLLKAGSHVGIDTKGTSLRNANLQLRSEPANPQVQVGPWNQSTIEADTQRRPLEIGSQ